MNSGLPPPLLVIVAHPDDEAIWFGGILKVLGATYGLMIVSATHASNPGRSEEFRRSCGLLGAMPILLDCPDGGNLSLSDPIPALEASLLENGIDPATFAGVISHSPSGEEHWHIQHIELHWKISRWAAARGIDFGFFAAHTGISAMGSLLTREEPARSVFRSWPKRRLLKEAIGLAKSVWKYRSYEVMKVRIDAQFKQNLLAIYEGQSLKGYAAYTSPFEIIFTKNPGLISVLKPLTQ